MLTFFPTGLCFALLCRIIFRCPKIRPRLNPPPCHALNDSKPLRATEREGLTGAAVELDEVLAFFIAFDALESLLALDAFRFRARCPVDAAAGAFAFGLTKPRSVGCESLALDAFIAFMGAGAFIDFIALPAFFLGLGESSLPAFPWLATALDLRDFAEPLLLCEEASEAALTFFFKALFMGSAGGGIALMPTATFCTASSHVKCIYL